MGKIKKGCPEGFPVAVWEKLNSIQANTEAMLDRSDNLERRVEVVEKAQLTRTVSLLFDKMSRMEITTSRRRHEIDHLKQHSMKNNLIFKFDDTTDIGKEIEGEDSVSVVRQFLIQVMHVPNASNFYIPIAHRLGDPRNKHRAILARFPIAAELDLILRHGNRLRGTRHGVSRQTPPSMTERNQLAMNTYNVKRIDFNNKARLNNGKLFVKGKV